MDLVILAAGMGSRFGGLKQLTPIDSEGNFIIDYSIYDAIKCGFDRVVFIIKEENLDEFRNTVGKRIEKIIKTAYVFQKNDNIPSKYAVPKDRIKPFGTAHALMQCKSVVKDKFAVINADDFYGRGAIKIVADFLKNTTDDRHFVMAGYLAKNTMSENGAVKRGVCAGNKYLSSIVESKLWWQDGKIMAKPLDSDNERVIDENTIVSMSLFGFSAKLLDLLEKDFYGFLDNADLGTCEYIIAPQLTKYIEEKKISLEIIKTDEKWYGMTYQADKKGVEKALQNLKQEGVYPAKLWQK